MSTREEGRSLVPLDRIRYTAKLSFHRQSLTKHSDYTVTGRCTWFIAVVNRRQHGDYTVDQLFNCVVTLVTVLPAVVKSDYSVTIVTVQSWAGSKRGGGQLNTMRCAMCHQNDPHSSSPLSTNEPLVYALPPIDPIFCHSKTPNF